MTAWDVASGAGTLRNADGGGCLTAPASGTIDFAALQVASCKGAVGQKWTVPAATASWRPARPSPGAGSG